MMHHRSTWQLFSLVVLLILPRSATSQQSAAYVTGGDRIKQGVYTYFYSKSAQASCQTVLFLGVGTAMDTVDYSTLSSLIVNKMEQMVVVVIDDNPNSITKQDPKKFSALVEELNTNLRQYVPLCAASASPQYLIGGHSASGQGAVEALPLLSESVTSKLIGFVGLAPYKLSSNMRINLPTLVWDSVSDSCGVTYNAAGLMAYKIAEGNNRVLFQLPKRSFFQIGFHCVYTNTGCKGMCYPKDGAWVRESVAQSLQVFVESLQSGTFVESNFQAILSNNVTMQFASVVSGNDESLSTAREL
ncbi:hypothetical protein MPSEU_000755000 [Mayamaea pseudoterrestris]|nr:hypothetical protein MPSEU_000755000 [Mayamaea pseudoterrestris]